MAAPTDRAGEGRRGARGARGPDPEGGPAAALGPSLLPAALPRVSGRARRVPAALAARAGCRRPRARVLPDAPRPPPAERETLAVPGPRAGEVRASPARREGTAAQDGGGRAGTLRGRGRGRARGLCVLRASAGRLRPVLPVSHVLSPFPSRVSAKWRLKWPVPFRVWSSLPPENQRSPCRADDGGLVAELGPEPGVGERDPGGGSFRSRGRWSGRERSVCGARRQAAFPWVACQRLPRTGPTGRASVGPGCVDAAAYHGSEATPRRLGRTPVTAARRRFSRRRRCGGRPFPSSPCT